jgi:putative SOS response-associated peptidase YedK
MCNLYSLTKGQAAIHDWFRAKHDRTDNLPLFPGIFPDQFAPIVRSGADGERELVMARWGMPGPPQFGGQPVTNIRNLNSPQWRGWLGKNRRCVVPATSFCEYADTKPRKTPTWFALSEDGRCSPSRADGRLGAAYAVPRARRSRAITSCSAF